jgi:tetratricopeptide (TPR) repeat protein
MVVIARAWLATAFMAFSQGNMARAMAASATCIALARKINDKIMLATIMNFESISRMNSGSFDNIDAHIEEALNVARETGDPYALGMGLGMLGSRMLMLGQDVETAKAHTAKALTLLKEHSNRFGYAMVLFALGLSARFQGRFADAREQFKILLPIFEGMGDNHRKNMIHSEEGHMERLEGRYQKAAQIYRATIVEWKRLGHRAAVANQLECFAFIAKIQEQPERAARLFGAAEMTREIINIPMNGMEQVEYDREVEELKTNIDKKIFASLWAEGRSMTMEQAVELAIQE